jgi:intracellular septation protein
MKLLFDFFPIILFFVVFKLKDIYWATATAIAASALLIAWKLLAKKKVEFQLWLSLFVVAIFGGLTLLLHNETFIKWKPTVLYLTLSLVLLFGQVVLKKNLIRAMLGKELTLPDNVWSGLSLAWILFFAMTASLNLIVAYSVSTATWVNFKLFGILGLTLIFTVIQAVVISKHLKPAQDKTPGGPQAPQN